MAQVQNLIIEQGTTFSTDLTVHTPEGEIMDLTNYSARCFARKNPASLTAYEITATVLNPKNEGNVRISMTPAQSRAVKPGRYLYSVEIFTALETDVVRVLEGLITFSPSMYSPSL
jgi:hypothetical protein